MEKLPIFYATKEGQTRRIAEVIAQRLTHEGIDAEPVDLRTAKRAPLDDLPVFVLGASVHLGKHPGFARRFVRKHLPSIPARPSAFFSVSMGASSPDPEKQAEAKANLDRFLVQTGWRPQIAECVAGRLAFTQYGWLTRRVMRSIAEKMGAPTDVTQDYEFTDWDAVHLFADRLIEQIRSQAA